MVSEIRPGVGITVPCDYCGKKFAIRPGRFKAHKHHFHSVECRNAFQRERNEEYQAYGKKEKDETNEIKTILRH